MRLDIAMVMEQVLKEGIIDMTNVSTQYAFYTDADVLFMGGGGDISTCTLPLPAMVSLSPQTGRGSAENSGVMAFNISAWRQEFPAFLEYGKRHKFAFVAFDQGGLARVNGFFGGSWGGAVCGSPPGG
jgi:hypothetical protein